MRTIHGQHAGDGSAGLQRKTGTELPKPHIYMKLNEVQVQNLVFKIASSNIVSSLECLIHNTGKPLTCLGKWCNIIY